MGVRGGIVPRPYVERKWLHHHASPHGERKWLHHNIAAVDIKAGSRNVARFARGEETNKMCDVLRLTEAWHWNVRVVFCAFSICLWKTTFRGASSENTSYKVHHSHNTTQKVLRKTAMCHGFSTCICVIDISLFTIPGQIALHVMPYFPISKAAALVVPIAAALLLV